MSDKDFKKPGKTEKDLKNEAIPENTDGVVADDAQENIVVQNEVGMETVGENPETREENSKKNTEKKLWIEYDDFWKCFR